MDREQLAKLGQAFSLAGAGFQDPMAVTRFVQQQEARNQEMAMKQIRLDYTMHKQGYERANPNDKVGDTADVIKIGNSIYKPNPNLLKSQNPATMEEISNYLEKQYGKQKGTWMPSSVRVGNRTFRYVPASSEELNAISPAKEYDPHTLEVRGWVKQGIQDNMSLDDIRDSIKKEGVSEEDFADLLLPLAKKQKRALSTPKPLSVRDQLMKQYMTPKVSTIK